jgi:transcriptional regulator with XRE-family HTH domain
VLHCEQLRAARAMLHMEQRELAKLARVSVETIKRIERSSGPLNTYAWTEHKLRSALEHSGIVFLPESDGLGPGVRLRVARPVRDGPPIPDGTEDRP